MIDSTQQRIDEIAKVLREEIDGDAAIDLLAAHMVALEDAHAQMEKMRAIAKKLAEDYKGQITKTVEVAEMGMAAAKFGRISTELRITDGRKSMRRKVNSAAARHKENRSMKEEAFSWLDANFASCKNLTEACVRIAAEVVPAEFRTVQKWGTEWRKLRSPSRVV